MLAELPRSPGVRTAASPTESPSLGAPEARGRVVGARLASPSGGDAIRRADAAIARGPPWRHARPFFPDMICSRGRAGHLMQARCAAEATASDPCESTGRVSRDALLRLRIAGQAALIDRHRQAGGPSRPAGSGIPAVFRGVEALARPARAPRGEVLGRGSWPECGGGRRCLPVRAGPSGAGRCRNSDRPKGQARSRARAADACRQDPLGRAKVRAAAGSGSRSGA